jgi:hypothetical protein
MLKINGKCNTCHTFAVPAVGVEGRYPDVMLVNLQYVRYTINFKRQK